MLCLVFIADVIHPWASSLALLFCCTSPLMLHLCPAHPKSCVLPLTSIPSFSAWSQETRALLHRGAQNDVDQLHSLQPAGYAQKDHSALYWLRLGLVTSELPRG